MRRRVNYWWYKSRLENEQIARVTDVYIKLWIRAYENILVVWRTGPFLLVSNVELTFKLRI